MKVVLLAIIIMLAMPTLVCAHDPEHLSDWIQTQGLTDPETGYSCCGDRDCFALPDDGVAETLNGFFIKETGEMWPKERVVWKSIDGRWWRCAPIVNGVRMTTRCLLGPPRGM
jgi:hypothetical protein